ncbi:MAG TPA: arsenic resistance N-acetyltransferase ArsN2 [Polyangiaceae bacterium]|nr:arsenic resistance N-acetyltransferase ArsN2 [Polyangiaceae bacterium]
MTPTFETASEADLEVIRALLSAGGLPVDDIDEHVVEFILAKQDGATIGTVAAEYAGEVALLRSLCVAPGHRGQAVGAGLLAAIQAKVVSRGVRELYLLTTTAAAYFESLGFSKTSRASAPSGIRATAQFRTLCPSTALCLRKVLSSSSNAATGVR